MGNSSSHNVHHIHQPSTASSTLQPSPNHVYHQQQLQHNQSYPRNNRKPPGFKVLPERVPGQKLRLTDNGSVLQNGGTISGRKILGSPQPQLQPQPPQYLHEEDADMVRHLRRRSDLMEDRDMVSMGKRFNSNPELLNDSSVSRGPFHRTPPGYPAPQEEHSLLTRKKSPKKAKAPGPPNGDRNSFIDARKAFANFIKSNGPRIDHQNVSPRSSDDVDRPRMVVYPSPSAAPQVSRAVKGEETWVQEESKVKSSVSSQEQQQRVKSMDSLANGEEEKGSFYLKRKDLNKSVDSLHKDMGKNHREIGRRASAASDSFFRRNNCSPPGRDESRPNGPDKWLFGKLLNSDRETALRHDEERLDYHSELSRKRDQRVQRRESLGNQVNPFQKQQYFYGQGDTNGPGVSSDILVGSLDRRPVGNVARTKEELPRGNQSKRTGTQQQLEEFSLREFGRREAMLLRTSADNANEGASSEDEMDINMQLRPTLPKRVPAIPRFSPSQVWRSLSLDEQDPAIPSQPVMARAGHNRRRISEHSSDEDNEGDVFEDRIQRVSRPVAPPRGSQEKSADSGISRDAGSPLPVVCDFDAVLQQVDKGHRNIRTSPPLHPPLGPHHDEGEKKSMWTPEEDLASDFDGGSGEGSAPVVAVNWPAHPKLIPRRDMFAPRVPRPGESFMTDSTDRRGGNGVAGKARKAKAAAAAASSSSASTPEAAGNSVVTAQTYNSVRKLKRSLSGVLGNGSQGKNGEDVTNLDENWSLSRSLPNSLHNGQEGERDLKDVRKVPVVTSTTRVLPRSESGPIHTGRPSYPEGEDHRLGGRGVEVDLAGHRRPFADLEGRVYSDQRQHARDGIGNGTGPAASWWYSPREGHIVYLPEYDAKRLEEDGEQGNDAKVSVWRKPKKFTYQSTVRQIERRQLNEKLSQEVAHKERQRDREMQLVNKVEEEFQKKRDREKENIRQQLRILSMESDTKENDEAFDVEDVTTQRARDYDDSNRRSRRLEEGSPQSLPALSVPPDDRSDKSQGFFSGIGKWMRRQQRLEKHQDRSPTHHHRQQSRLEPEGASYGEDLGYSWEQGRADVTCGLGPPGQRHSIAVDGGSSSEGRWREQGASASDGGWRTDKYQQNCNRQKESRKPMDYKRYGEPEKKGGINLRSQSFSQIWDEDVANRQSGISSSRIQNNLNQAYQQNKSSYRPVPFGANSRAEANMPSRCN